MLLHTKFGDSRFSLVLVHQRIRGFAFMRYINPRLTLTRAVPLRASELKMGCDRDNAPRSRISYSILLYVQNFTILAYHVPLGSQNLKRVMRPLPRPFIPML